MIIGILWWTWRTWIALRWALLGAWHSVISLIRHPEKFRAESEQDTYVVWSATNQADIETIVSRVDVLIDATSVGFFHKKPATLYSQVAQTIIDARPQWTAIHLIVMSSAWTHHGRQLPRPANRWYEFFLWDVANDKEKAESLLEGSSLPRTIIKSPLLTNWPATSFTLISFSTYQPSLFHTISRTTLGKVIEDCLVDLTKHANKKIVPLKE